MVFVDPPTSFRREDYVAFLAECEALPADHPGRDEIVGAARGALELFDRAERKAADPEMRDRFERILARERGAERDARLLRRFLGDED